MAPETMIFTTSGKQVHMNEYAKSEKYASFSYQDHKDCAFHHDNAVLIIEVDALSRNLWSNYKNCPTSPSARKIINMHKRLSNGHTKAALDIAGGPIRK